MVRVWPAAAVAACLFGARAAHAQPLPSRLHVHRAAGAESCPDEEELKKQVEALAGMPILSRDGEPELFLHVRIAPQGEGFRAEVKQSGFRTGTRALEDSGPGCDGLGRGLAVILALLLDAPLGARPPPAPTPSGPAPSPGAPLPLYVLPEVPPLPEEKPTPKFPPLMGSIGPVYVTGIVPSDAAGLTLAFEGYLPLVSFGASVLWIPHEPRALEGTSAKYTYAGARTRACARQPDLAQYGLAACLRFGAGLRSGELTDARTEEILDDADGAYVAFGGELEISRRIVGPLGVYANLGVDVAVVQDELTLAWQDVVVDPDEKGVSFDTGVGIRFWLQPEE